MPSYTYQNISNLDPEILFRDIEDAGLLQPDLDHDDVTEVLDLVYATALTGPEEATLLAVVTAHSPEIEVARATKYAEIDLKTRDLINQGIPFAGETFSFSLEAQANWMGIFQAANAGFITFPRDVSSSTGSYTFATLADYTNFYLTGMSIMESHVGSGRDIKDQITAAVDLAAINAIVDDR